MSLQMPSQMSHKVCLPLPNPCMAATAFLTPSHSGLSACYDSSRMMRFCSSTMIVSSDIRRVHVYDNSTGNRLG